MRALGASTTPASQFPFSFHLNNNVHLALAEIQADTVPDVLEIGGLRGDDMDNAEDSRVIVVVALLTIVVAGFMGMGVRMPVAVTVAMMMARFLLDVLEPELWYCVPYHASDFGHSAEDTAQIVFEIGVQREQEDFGCG